MNQTNLSTPIFREVQQAGLCALEVDMLQSVLNAEVRREACLRDGDTVCTLALVNHD